MQTATFYATPATPPNSSTDNPAIRTSVTHLLARTHGLPCSAAAQAFTQLVQPSNRFQIALDVLLPLLTGHTEMPPRILASYILYSLYAMHPVAINPFRSAFVEVFNHERDVAKTEAERGGVSETEQLAWVLWKILKGDGNDLAPYSPATLSRSPLPPKLRAANLTIDESIMIDEHDGMEQPQDAQKPLSINTNGSHKFENYSLSPTSSIRSPIESGSIASSTSRGLQSELTAKVVRLLLDACQRVLSLSEQRLVLMSLSNLSLHTLIDGHNLPALVANNPVLGHPLVVSLMKIPADSSVVGLALEPHTEILETLQQLPPTLPSFDILGRLLRDGTIIPAGFMKGTTTVADLVRTDVLGGFILNAIDWIERAEKESSQGLINDDRIAKAIQNLCRFYNSLMKLNILDPNSDADSTEMAHFALSHSHYEEANALYRVLVMGKF